MAEPETESAVMACMEVRGGSEAVVASLSSPGLEMGVYSRPYGGGEAGGDVHYVSSCATGRITRVLLADVTGHGEQVTQTAVVLRRLMQRYVNYIDQSRFVERLNRHFNRTSDAGSFATAVVLSYFEPTSTLSVINAGHPRPLIYRARKRAWEMLEDDPDTQAAQVENASLPLGILDHVRYPQQRITLDAGDMVICYSDALIEARRQDQSLLGSAGLLEVVRRVVYPEQSDTATAQRVISAVEEATARPIRDDDVTVLMLRAMPGTSKLAWWRRALGPFDAMWQVFKALLTGRTVPWPEVSVPSIFGAFVPVFNRWWRGRR